MISIVLQANRGAFDSGRITESKATPVCNYGQCFTLNSQTPEQYLSDTDDGCSPDDGKATVSLSRPLLWLCLRNTPQKSQYGNSQEQRIWQPPQLFFCLPD